jgi:chromosome partitioning protein
LRLRVLCNKLFNTIAVRIPKLQITSVINQKGGVGKTALSVGLASGLAELGKSVLLVDLDPQGHATTEFLGMPEAKPNAPTLAAAMSGMWKGSASELVMPYNHVQFVENGSLDVIPSSPAMLGLIRRLDQQRVRDLQLARVLSDIEYDHVIIDCPPALDVLSNNALAITDGVIVPVQPDKTSIRAVKLLQQQMNYITEALQRTPISHHGLVPGVYRRPMSQYNISVMEEMESFGLPILPHLPLNVVVNEAAAAGLPPIFYAPQSDHAQAHREIAWQVDTTFTGRHRRRVEYVNDFVFEEFVNDVARSRRDRLSSASAGAASLDNLRDLLPQQGNRRVH